MKILYLLRWLLIKYWYIILAIMMLMGWLMYRKAYISKKGLTWFLIILLAAVIVGAGIGFYEVIQHQDSYQFHSPGHSTIQRGVNDE